MYRRVARSDTPRRSASSAADRPGRFCRISMARSARAVGLMSDGTSAGYATPSRNRKRIVRISFYGGAVTEFREQDLTGAHFEEVRLKDATMRSIDFTGTQIRSALFKDARMRGVEMVDVDISGELRNVVVNGVDIVPLVEAELNRRMPERARMRPDDADGFRAAWAILERLWDGTVARAKALPPKALHDRVDGEWSFVDTLRHLNFASAAWGARMVLGDPSPWHPLDLPWEEAPAWDDIPVDREAKPSLDEVLAVRRERQAMVRDIMRTLTDGQLTVTVSGKGQGWPPAEETIPVKECLRVILNEEWEHRLYAERDLTKWESEN